MAITINRQHLAAVVSRLIEQTGAIIHTQIVEPIERTPHAERSVRAQRKESCRTMAEARAKAARETDDLRGEFQARQRSPCAACSGLIADGAGVCSGIWAWMVALVT